MKRILKKSYLLRKVLSIVPVERELMLILRLCIFFCLTTENKICPRKGSTFGCGYTKHIPHSSH